ncbi:MAG: hypothetical protein AAGB12_13020 [Pseudomonadota bacterium]
MMKLDKHILALILLFLSASVGSMDSFASSHDDDETLVHEASAVFVETHFSITESGHMQVTLHTDDVNADQVITMSNYFAEFTDFVEIIDIHASEEKLELPQINRLILQGSVDPGTGPVGVHGN